MKTAKYLTRTVLASALLTVVGLVTWRVAAHFGAGSNHFNHRPPLLVDTVHVSRRSVPYVISAPGIVDSNHTVNVNAQVSGMLSHVYFSEGDIVHAGQLLFQIDPAPFQAAVEEAKGQIIQDEAKLEEDKSNAARMAKLIKRGYVTHQNYENAMALVKQDKGILASDKAKLEQAEIQLSYTKITAPITGKTGSLAYKSGNLIQANSSSPLVTINQISPILVQFSIAESSLTSLIENQGNPSLTVFVQDQSGNVVSSKGKLVFIDNTIDQSTGALTLKAKFVNAKHELWPGELVTVGLQLKVDKNAMVIPSVAVQPGQTSSFVYTVRKGHVAIQDVRVKREYKGYAIITKGLNLNDTVIVHIPRDLRNGIAVKTRMLSDDAVVSSLPGDSATANAPETGT